MLWLDSPFYKATNYCAKSYNYYQNSLFPRLRKKPTWSTWTRDTADQVNVSLPHGNVQRQIGTVFLDHWPVCLNGFTKNSVLFCYQYAVCRTEGPPPLPKIQESHVTETFEFLFSCCVHHIYREYERDKNFFSLCHKCQFTKNIHQIISDTVNPTINSS